MLKGGLGSMMKKAQEMQENMQKMQEQLGDKRIVGESAAGGIKITLNGHYGCEGVEIDDELLREDKDMLEALIAAAISDAANKTKAFTQEEMAGLTDGLNLPAGFKLPF